MGKLRKTREQKIAADYHHSLYTFENKNISITPQLVTTTVSKSTYSYSYVLNDMRKTGILMLLILAAQIILLFLLKDHIVKLPFITY